MILNLGPVREGERLIYNGLPWEVASLNFQASLHNPLLQGGKLQIPIRDLINYNSRRYDAEEPWFPSKAEDWVVLNDETYGKVRKQTPELVELEVFDAIKTYPVQSYLESNPYNLSQQGFTLFLGFGLDYQHQNNITNNILNQMQKELDEGLRKSAFAEYIESFSLTFDKADGSSLNYVAQLKMNGEAAAQYLQIPRDFQRLAVESCNRNNWIIPFEQITVHKAKFSER